MRKHLPARWPSLWLIVALGFLSLPVASIYLVMHIRSKPLTPAVPAVSTCRGLAPGMRRIGNRYGVQFDVPAKEFTVSEGWGDAIPVAHGFDLSPKNSKSLLVISLARPLDNVAAVDPMRVFSTHVENRTVYDDKGVPIGEDNWGYLRSGERWRKVQFRGRVAARYGLVDRLEAKLFDRVINSACVLPAPTP